MRRSLTIYKDSSNDLASENNPTKNKIYMNDNSHSNIDVKEEIKSQKDKEIIKKTTPKSLNKKDNNKFFSKKRFYGKKFITIWCFFKKKKC